jgi:hypothetical protein
VSEIRLVQTGTADPSGAATPISANVISLGSDVPVRVTLTKDYAMLCPVGFPARPCFTGSMPLSNYPHTIPTGTTLSLLKCETDALVAAGAATLV